VLRPKSPQRGPVLPQPSVSGRLPLELASESLAELDAVAYSLSRGGPEARSPKLRHVAELHCPLQVRPPPAGVQLPAQREVGSQLLEEPDERCLPAAAVGARFSAVRAGPARSSLHSPGCLQRDSKRPALPPVLPRDAAAEPPPDVPAHLALEPLLPLRDVEAVHFSPEPPPACAP
jgi:hypothetical protein